MGPGFIPIGMIQGPIWKRPCYNLYIFVCSSYCISNLLLQRSYHNLREKKIKLNYFLPKSNDNFHQSFKQNIQMQTVVMINISPVTIELVPKMETLKKIFVSQ